MELIATSRSGGSADGEGLLALDLADNGQASLAGRRILVTGGAVVRRLLAESDAPIRPAGPPATTW